MVTTQRTVGREVYFLGNPGVGKSTLLNGFMGQVKFRSALNSEGVTTIFRKITDPATGIGYCDTPGLDEPDKQERAAKEIVKALRDNQQKQRKIIFVVTLEGGRVRNADLVTMRAILDSMHTKANASAQPGAETSVPYGVIINKVPQKTKDRILKDDGGTLFGKICASLVAGGLSKNPPADIVIYPRKAELEDEDNVLHEPSQELKEFLQGLPSATIDKVDDINMDKLKELTEQISKLAKDNAVLKGELTKQMKEFTQKLMKMDAEHKKDKAVAMERHRKEMIAREKEFRDALEENRRRQEEQARLHREEIQEAADRHANQIDQMREENHERELEMMRIQAEKEERLQEAMRAEREERDRQELEQLQKDIRELKENHEQEMDKMRRSQDEQRESMRQASKQQGDECVIL